MLPLAQSSPAPFGKYLLDAEIARGGMARVYLARLRGLGGFEKRLVVKQVLPELARDPTFVSMFVQEAKTLVQMSHPHIVPVYELGVVDGVYFLAMEHIDGVTLAEVLRHGPLSPPLAADVGIQVADALKYAHGRFGLVHRDVTPRNVMIDSIGHVRLLDFGIAAPVEGLGEGEIFGSQGYMSPEQARGDTVGRESDVFSLGAVLFEALSGSPAFWRSSASAIHDALLVAPAPTLELNDAPELVALVTAMLQRLPSDRPTATDVAQTLRGWLARARPGGVAADLATRVEQATAAANRSDSTRPVDTAALTTRASSEQQTIATSHVLRAMLDGDDGSAAGSTEQPSHGIDGRGRAGEGTAVEGTVVGGTVVEGTVAIPGRNSKAPSAAESAAASGADTAARDDGRGPSSHSQPSGRETDGTTMGVARTTTGPDAIVADSQGSSPARGDLRDDEPDGDGPRTSKVARSAAGHVPLSALAGGDGAGRAAKSSRRAAAPVVEAPAAVSDLRRRPWLLPLVAAIAGIAGTIVVGQTLSTAVAPDDAVDRESAPVASPSPTGAGNGMRAHSPPAPRPPGIDPSAVEQPPERTPSAAAIAEARVNGTASGDRGVEGHPSRGDPPTAPQPRVHGDRLPASGATGATATGAATVTINATPWADATLDGRALGATPQRSVPVSAGAHVVELDCPPLGRSARVPLRVQPGASLQVLVDLSVDPPRVVVR